MTRCKTHGISTHRTQGQCAACRAEQVEAMAAAAQARANEARDKAAKAQRERVRDLTAEWWLSQAADCDEAAAAYDEQARELWETAKAQRMLDRLGPHAHERCPDDDWAAHQKELGRRETESLEQYGVKGR